MPLLLIVAACVLPPPATALNTAANSAPETSSTTIGVAILGAIDASGYAHPALPAGHRICFS